MVDYDDWLRKIDEKVAKLPIGAEFEIEDLFDKKVWTKLKGEERQELGRKYKRKFNKGELLNVEFIGKDTGDNHAHYRKIKGEIYNG